MPECVHPTHDMIQQHTESGREVRRVTFKSRIHPNMGGTEVTLKAMTKLHCNSRHTHKRQGATMSATISASLINSTSYTRARTHVRPTIGL